MSGNKIICPGNPATSGVKHIEEHTVVCLWGHKVASKKNLPLWWMWQKDLSARLWSLLAYYVKHVGILHSWNQRCPEAPLPFERHFTPYRYRSVVLAGSSACLLIPAPSFWSCGLPAQGVIGEDIRSLQLPIGDPGPSFKESAGCMSARTSRTRKGQSRLSSAWSARQG